MLTFEYKIRRRIAIIDVEFSVDAKSIDKISAHWKKFPGKELKLLWPANTPETEAIIEEAWRLRDDYLLGLKEQQEEWDQEMSLK